MKVGQKTTVVTWT